MDFENLHLECKIQICKFMTVEDFTNFCKLEEFNYLHKHYPNVQRIYQERCQYHFPEYIQYKNSSSWRQFYKKIVRVHDESIKKLFNFKFSNTFDLELFKIYVHFAYENFGNNKKMGELFATNIVCYNYNRIISKLDYLKSLNVYPNSISANYHANNPLQEHVLEWLKLNTII